MLQLLFFLFTYNYIPKEFEQLKRKAIKSSLLRPLEEFDPEPIISPSKPFIRDGFVGTVLYPVFGITVKDLKGYAISKNKQHLALIVDRKTKEGISIIQEHTYFFGGDNYSFSLSQKFADDGEVAIFNITEIDPLSAFYNFDLTLTSLSGKCKSSFGKQLGARCEQSLTLNWDTKTNQPSKISKEYMPPEVRDYFQLYGGVSVNSHVSAMIKKRGAAIQFESDNGFDASFGAGAYINAHNFSYKSNSDEEFIIGNPKEKLIAQNSFNIFLTSISFRAYITSRAISKHIEYNFKHRYDIDVVRKLTVHIKKGVTVSTKHASSNDYEKEVKVEKIKTEAIERGFSIEEDDLNENFKATFAIKTGVRFELAVSSIIAVKFQVEPGVEVGHELNLGLDTEKCTFPGLYGAFTPYTGVYVDFAGQLYIAGIKLFGFFKPLTKIITKKNIFNGCFFDGASSSEINKQLLENPKIKRSVIQAVNPVVNNASLLYSQDHQPIVFLGKNQNSQTDSYLRLSSLNLNQTSTSKRADHIFVKENKNFSSINFVVLPDTTSYLVKYPFEESKINTPSISFTAIRNDSQPVLLGNQFNFSNFQEYKNFRNRFMPTKSDVQKIGLILHTKTDGYFCDPLKYYIVDEIYDEENDNVNNWLKISIIKITRNDQQNLALQFFRFNGENNEEIPIINGIQVFTPGSRKGSNMVPKFDDNYVLFKKTKSYKNDDKLIFVVASEDSNILGTVNITYGDTLKTTFLKTITNSNIKISFKCDSSFNDVEYTLQLEDYFKKEIQKIPNLKMNGIVARSFVHQNTDRTPIFFTGESQLSEIASMKESELYGTFVFYFKDPGYDIKSNNNVFAFIKMEGSQPLLKSSKVVDENDELFIIKLEIGKSVSIDDNNNYFLSVPFRRRSKSEGQTRMVLYSIYQSTVKKDDDDSPFCDSFPEFKINTNKNFYVGCIKTYTDVEDFAENKWDHYPDTINIKANDYPTDLPKDKEVSFARLHVITLTNNKNLKDPVTVVAKQQYISFPNSTRNMIIEDNYVNMFKKYAPKYPLKISCTRCGAIHKDSYSDSNKLYQEQGGNFILDLEDINDGFVLQAICKSEKESYCLFEYDISKYGVTLLEFYKPEIHEIIINSTTKESLRSFYPGVEEIYEADEDTTLTSKSRLNINCRRQIVTKRNDKILLNKPWEGNIKVIATHIENAVIKIDFAKSYSNGYAYIHMKGKGFNKLNNYIDDEQSLPFNPRIFAENEATFKKQLSQLGITITKTKEDTINDNDIYLDDDGILVVRQNLFSVKKLGEIVAMNYKIDMIDIPPDNYILSEVKNDETKNVSEKKGKGGCSGGNSYEDKNLINPKVLGNFKIESVYLGASPNIIYNLNFMIKLIQKFKSIFGRFFSYPDIIHTAIWVGEKESNDDTEGAIFVYGRYFNTENSSIYLSNDGAKSYKMTLGDFKKKYPLIAPIKLKTNVEMRLFEFYEKVKISGRWEVKDYNWPINNCQHFTAKIIDILHASREIRGKNDWIDLPNPVIKSLEHNENSLEHINDK